MGYPITGPRVSSSTDDVYLSSAPLGLKSRPGSQERVLLGSLELLPRREGERERETEAVYLGFSAGCEVLYLYLETACGKLKFVDSVLVFTGMRFLF